MSVLVTANVSKQNDELVAICSRLLNEAFMWFLISPQGPGRPFSNTSAVTLSSGARVAVCCYRACTPIMVYYMSEPDLYIRWSA